MRLLHHAGRAARGCAVLLALGLNTIVLSLVLFLCSLAKLAARTNSSQQRLRRFLAKLPVLWISVNNGVLTLARVTQWDIEIPAGLERDGCYLVVSNHQSWTDVLVLQRSFNRHLPFLRFFVKRSLIWFPFLGQAWWALDMPFMKRYSAEQLARRPELRGQDLESARAACEKFRDMPVGMMTFPEGTRFSPVKRDAANVPFRHVLEPRIGGIAQVLYALGDQLDSLVDVTILYPVDTAQVTPTFWQLVSGQIPRVVVRARQVAVPGYLRGRNFRKDESFRRELANWVNGLWQAKDTLLSHLLAGRGG